MNQNLDQAMRAVADIVFESGRTSAKNFVVDNYFKKAEAAEKQAAAFRAAGERANQLIELLAPDAPEDQPSQLPLDTDAIDPPPDFRDSVLQVAGELAKASGTVQLVALLDAIRARGVVIPGSKPGTTVGNIMSKAQGWTRVSAGEYKRTGKE